ncbi:MAG: UDP-N-acetylglucosamine--N-acetylmuramyl-(pentapeptide) pyrophosphoryl-undecaprenol N-acetylglucosamine transferase, partial [Clostridiales bacterium]|nr:UDP-N-acetylglucosamine--N-acetylmuramyl-(pentapeptide) pyrophosphoryl-undecaprenol N-acetylglucosamine transferase [Clostridiales bacterium]
MKTIVFAGGGTAGHVMPNIALIEQLKHDYNCVYVGGNGMEKDICASRNIPFYRIDTVKFRRDKILSNINVPFKLRACVKNAKRVLDEINPSLIFSKGGYAALPVVLASKVPVLCHESDFSAGLATKLSKRKATHILCAFEPCAKKFKKGLYVGTPLNQSLYRGAKDLSHYGLSGSKPIIAVVGGSSGAAAVNAAVVEALPRLLQKYEVIHMTGKNKAGGATQKGYATVEFENDMARLYATADIIITRAGANALAECIALKKPTIAIPLEKASRGDQVQNAEYYSNCGAIKVLRENELKTLIAAVDEVYNNKYKYVSAMSCINVDGTKKIVSEINKILN